MLTATKRTILGLQIRLETEWQTVSLTLSTGLTPLAAVPAPKAVRRPGARPLGTAADPHVSRPPVHRLRARPGEVEGRPRPRVHRLPPRQSLPARDQCYKTFLPSETAFQLFKASTGAIKH